MRALYYDRDGYPVSQEQWQWLGRQPGYSRIGHADGIRHGREITVVTYWLGICAGDCPGRALIFHTYADVRRPADRQPAYRRLWGWPALEAARAGHEAVTAWITGLADWLAGEASQFPGPLPGPDHRQGR